MTIILGSIGANKKAKRVSIRAMVGVFNSISSRAASSLSDLEISSSPIILPVKSPNCWLNDRLVVSEILNSISDFERMGDHCINISYVAQDKNEQDIHFSPAGHKEVAIL